MGNFTIGITTFSKRYDFVENLLQQIRKRTDRNIIITINGEKDGEFDEQYRVKILNLCAKYKSIYPIFFIETRGLSKMWNSILITATDDNILLLNDDIEILSNDIFEKIEQHISSADFTGITKVNNSFSHFIVNKNIMENIGYFDERLLGFGEEDGDITFRMLKKNLNINNIYANNVTNIVSDIRHEHVKSGIGKYSDFNRQFIYNHKYKADSKSNIRGMFDLPMNQILEDLNQYPNEKFFRENKKNL